MKKYLILAVVIFLGYTALALDESPYRNMAQRKEIMDKVKAEGGGRSCDGADMDDPKEIRVIYPGMAVTMDHSEERLNVEVDNEGHYIKSYCG